MFSLCSLFPLHSTLFSPCPLLVSPLWGEGPYGNFQLRPSLHIMSGYGFLYHSHVLPAGSMKMTGQYEYMSIAEYQWESFHCFLVFYLFMYFFFLFLTNLVWLYLWASHEYPRSVGHGICLLAWASNYTIHWLATPTNFVSSCPSTDWRHERL